MRRYAHLALVGLAMALTNGCGSTSGRGDGGTGGANSGGRGGGSGGDACPRSVPTGGTGGAGSGGTGGAAGHGSGGSGGFDCTGVTVDGDCSAFPVGLVCILPGKAPLGCVCVPANGGPKWQCNSDENCALCPNQPGGPAHPAGRSGTCTETTITTITNFGGCKYPPTTVCSCEFTDAGPDWICKNAVCPAAQPTGSCAGWPASSFPCDYGVSSGTHTATSSTCYCLSADGGAPRWRCNGWTTPDCPASWPGGGVDCSTFQPGTVCSYPAGNVTGGPCTCTEGITQGSSTLTWQCGNG